MNVPASGEPFTAQGFRKAVQAIRELAFGGSNATGTFALGQTETRTTIEDRRCLETSTVLLAPMSEAAGASAWWVDSVTRGSFTVGHAAAGADARFAYELRQA